ncbi:S8 family serine peptidase [Dokdonella sp. MW10]|uniref:S8 family serine peptidase n=1 Tax=Dokdonella sp. MW10 TaxID=2992926 RepID=UPI003F7FA905
MSYHRHTGGLLPLAAALSVTLVSGMAHVSATPVLGAHPTAAGVPPVVTSATAIDSRGQGNAPTLATSSDRARYVIIFKRPALAAYQGDQVGIAKAPRAKTAQGRDRLDAKSSEARDYVQWVRGEQSSFISEAEASLGRSIEVVEQLQHALNAVVVDITEAEAEILRRSDEVESVEREPDLKLQTYGSPQFIGATTPWTDTAAPNGIGYKGEGIVIGIIDTGVNPLSHSFRATGDDGYTHTNPLGEGNYLGLCALGEALNGLCNGKLIGMYSRVSEGRDLNGHGSHTASTAGGGVSDSLQGGGTFRFSGVAPHANLISYNACPPAGCNTLGMIDQAVADGIVDVINYSIGGVNSGPWLDASSQAFLNATAAGIFVAQSAGNDGPNRSGDVDGGDGFVNSYDPWVTTVASTTPNARPGYTLTVRGVPGPITLGMGGNPPPTAAPPPNIPLIESPSFANGTNDGCVDYPANAFRRPQSADGVGGIAVIHLDGETSACPSGQRRTRALAAGAVAVIFVDVTRLTLGASDTTYSLLMSEWTTIRQTLGNVSVAGDATATVSPLTPVSRQGDLLSTFSSRGPSRWGTLKPDISAPGDEIFAAISPESIDGYSSANSQATSNLYGLKSGTSMASPHIAGAAALVRQAHPDWSPMEVKSALMTTSRSGVLVADGVPANPLHVGAGRVDLTRALRAGLLFDETIENFRNADPSNGGDESQLNLASYYRLSCVGMCTFPRTVRNATGKAQTWTVSVSGLPEGSFTLRERSLRLAARGEASFTLSIDASRLTPDTWTFGEVTLTPSDDSVPESRLPVAIRSEAAVMTADAEVVNELVVRGTQLHRNIVIKNTGGPLRWRVATDRMHGYLAQRPVFDSEGENGTYYTYDNMTLGATGTEIDSTNARNFYVADWFDVLVEGVRITDLRYDGYATRTGSPLPIAGFADQFAWRIYADDAGSPNGFPGGGAGALFQYPEMAGGAGPGSPGISFPPSVLGEAISGMRLDLEDAGIGALAVRPGRYWFNAAPTLYAPGSFVGKTRIRSIPGKAPLGKVTVPNNPLVRGTWYDLSTIQGTIVGSAAPITVGASVPCGASWLRYDNTRGGTVAHGGQATLGLTIDASALEPGLHAAYLCISSDGTATEFLNKSASNLLIPVRIKVVDQKELTGLAVDRAEATPSPVLATEKTLITVDVLPATSPGSSGIEVKADLAPIGGRAAQPLNDEGLYGDERAGDGRFSFLATVQPGTASGNKALKVTVKDAQGRSAGGTVTLRVGASVALSASGTATPEIVYLPGGQTTLTVTVTAATGPEATSHTVTADLSSLGRSSNATLEAVEGEPLMFNRSVTLGASVTPGPKAVPITVQDSTGRRFTTTILISVAQPGVDAIFTSGFDANGG